MNEWKWITTFFCKLQTLLKEYELLSFPVLTTLVSLLFQIFLCCVWWTCVCPFKVDPSIISLSVFLEKFSYDWLMTNSFVWCVWAFDFTICKGIFRSELSLEFGSFVNIFFSHSFDWWVYYLRFKIETYAR